MTRLISTNGRSGWTQGDMITDGQNVACCICFGWFIIDELGVDEHGDKVDVCRECMCREAEYRDRSRLSGA